MALEMVELVKNLRDRTGAGMMDCKAALSASAGDIEKAIDFLRKKGLSQAAKRAGRDAKEGLVWARIEGHHAAILEVNCETDFVARTDDFRDLAVLALEEVLSKGPEAIASERSAQKVNELSGKIGEKILLRRAKVLESKTGLFFIYIHSNQKLGVVVELDSDKAPLKKGEAVERLGKDLAMQVAAGNPICIRREEVSGDTLEREKAVYKAEVKDKPAAIVDKIVQGKLDKFFKANCLLEQAFIRDDKVTIQGLVDEASKKAGQPVQVKQFVRFQVGEVCS